MTIENPYQASSIVIVVPSECLSWRTYLSRIFWFLPGTILGRELERCIHHGLAKSLKRFEAMSIQSVIELTVFACSCLLLTMLWRLPRQFFIGGIRIQSGASFVSGILMMYLASVVIRSGTFIHFWEQTVIILMSGILAVECESILSFLLGKRCSTMPARSA